MSTDAFDLDGAPEERPYDAALTRRLLADLKPYRGWLVLGIVTLIGASILDLLAPWLTKVAIDSYIGAGRMQGLGLVVMAYVGVLLGGAGLRYAQTIIAQVMGQRMMRDLRGRVFSHLQTLPLAYFDRQPVGRLMTRVTNDVESLNEMFSSGVVSVGGDIVTLVGIVVAMMLLDMRLALVTLGVLPLLLAATWVFRQKVRYTYRDVRRRLARLNAFLQENITGMMVVQVFRQEEANRRRFDRLNRDYLDAFLKTIFYYAVFFPVVELVSALAIAAILASGGHRVAHGALSVGVLVAFIQYVERFFMPVRDLSEKYNLLQAAMAASERIFGLLDTVPEPGAGERPRERLPVAGRIRYEGVNFSYVPGEPVLADVSFDVEPGERIALVGATGAGKTSVVSLLMRFYEPTSGRILLDGTELTRIPPRTLRREIGLVLQEPFLKSGTVWENLVLGRPEAAREEVDRAARMVNAHRVINRLPAGYDSEVLERGGNFSTGEKQLLALCRVLVANPRILVLDEATSSVDPETELLIQEGIERLLEGRTSLVIAHRLSTVRNSDRVLVFHRGRLREEGSHEALIARRGIYYRLAAIGSGAGLVDGGGGAAPGASADPLSVPAARRNPE